MGTLESAARIPLDVMTFGTYEAGRAGAQELVPKMPDLPPAVAGAPPAPDSTDAMVRAAKANERRRMLQMQGLAKSFNAPSVNSQAAPTSLKKLTGQ